MGRKTLAPERRAALIAATIEEIHARGTLGVTLAAIARRAGVSAPLTAHYFGSKEALIQAALRDLVVRLRREIATALKCGHEPRQRLSALVAANFSDDQFRPETISTWLNFYVYAQADIFTQRLLRICLRRLTSNLRYELVRLIPRPAACELAQVIAALVDGFYLRHALREAPPDAAAAIARIETVIDLYLPAHLRQPMTEKPHEPST